jgi:hypothetical protein
MNAPPEDLVRQTLNSLVAPIETPPDAYRRAAADWRRRERRRKVIATIVAIIIIVIADIIGLWALNRATNPEESIYDTGTSLSISISP